MGRTPSFAELFEREQPVIAMAHLPPLPGTPLYDEPAGVDGIVEAVRADLEILLGADVDAVMFCNEGDRPYALQAGPEGVAVLARVVTELAPRDRPFGVDFLWDAGAALAVAVATGASFIREVTTGVYESDMGLWNTDAAGLLRERRRLGAEHVRVLMNVTPELASPLGRRAVGEVARSRRRLEPRRRRSSSRGRCRAPSRLVDAVREAKEAVAGRRAGAAQHGREVDQRPRVPRGRGRGDRRQRPQGRRLHLEPGRSERESTVSWLRRAAERRWLPVNCHGCDTHPKRSVTVSCGFAH